MVVKSLAEAKVPPEHCSPSYIAGGASRRRARCSATASAREHLLLQSHAKSSVDKYDSQKAQDMVALDQAAAQHISSLFSSPAKVAAALAGGFDAIKSALSSFSKAVPDIDAGFSAFGLSLFEVVSGLLPADVTGTKQFKDFELQWSDALGLLGEKADVLAELGSWAMDGKVKDLVLALSTALSELAGTAQASPLPATGIEIAKFLFGLRDSLEGAGEGILLLEEGDQLDGVRSVYDGLTAAVDDLVPSDLMNDDMYAAVVKGASGDLGGVITGLLQHVHNVVDSQVCWKRTKMRERARPSVCDRGFSLSENQWCLPDEGTTALRRLWRFIRRGRAKRHTLRAEPARCPASAETRGSWCYSACEAGYTETHFHCKQACRGQYFVDSPLMCGSRQGTIALALLEIVAQTALAATTQVGLVKIVKDAGLVLASQMTDILQAFVDFAKPFGHPQCPDVVDGASHGSAR